MITENQKKVIDIIENNLDIKFKGKMKDEARIFIMENIDNSKKASINYKINKKYIYNVISDEEYENSRFIDKYDCNPDHYDSDSFDDDAYRSAFDPNW